MKKSKAVTIDGHLIKIDSDGMIFRINGNGIWEQITNVELFDLVDSQVEEPKASKSVLNKIQMFKNLTFKFRNMKKSILLLSAVCMLFSFTYTYTHTKGKIYVNTISNYVEQEDGTITFTLTDLDAPKDHPERSFDVVIDSSVKLLEEEDLSTGKITKYVYSE